MSSIAKRLGSVEFVSSRRTRGSLIVRPTPPRSDLRGSPRERRGLVRRSPPPSPATLIRDRGARRALRRSYSPVDLDDDDASTAALYLVDASR